MGGLYNVEPEEELKKDFTFGETDEIGYSAINKVHVHDVSKQQFLTN